MRPVVSALNLTASDLFDNSQVDLSQVKGLLSASSTTGVEMDMKEFSHTNDLIESAEEWMARVREVLESGEAATLRSLSALLSEADGIPVTMDEQELLTAGIQARQWRLRVDETLNSGKANLQDLLNLGAEVSTVGDQSAGVRRLTTQPTSQSASARVHHAGLAWSVHLLCGLLARRERSQSCRASRTVQITRHIVVSTVHHVLGRAGL